MLVYCLLPFVSFALILFTFISCFHSICFLFAFFFFLLFAFLSIFPPHLPSCNFFCSIVTGAHRTRMTKWFIHLRLDCVNTCVPVLHMRILWQSTMKLSPAVRASVQVSDTARGKEIKHLHDPSKMSRTPQRGKKKRKKKEKKRKETAFFLLSATSPTQHLL
jgi:hypothetical protein